MGKIIGLTYDLKTDWVLNENDPKDLNAEFDSPYVVDAVVKALESGGHKVKRIGNVRSLLRQIDNLNVDIVMNLCEGYLGRNRESQVPLLLEMYSIPFIGSDALSQAITLDKSVAKQIFIAEGVPTPRYFKARSSDNLQQLNKIGFPLIVKTCHEGTSKGISDKSRVEDLASLKRQVDLINKTYNQPALVEEFIKGKEFTVAVLGNEHPRAMPVIQTTIDGQLDLGDKFYTFERVQNANTIRYICPAQISAELEKKIREIAVRAYQAIGCRDMARIDFRVDEKGNPYVLEINPLPSFSREDVFNIFPKVIHSTYEEIINYIVNLALERHGLLDSKIIIKNETLVKIS